MRTNKFYINANTTSLASDISFTVSNGLDLNTYDQINITKINASNIVVPIDKYLNMMLISVSPFNKNVYLKNGSNIAYTLKIDFENGKNIQYDTKTTLADTKLSSGVSITLGITLQLDIYINDTKLTLNDLKNMLFEMEFYFSKSS